MRILSWRKLRKLLAIAKHLPYVDPFFMQECPLCGTPQRMMIRGNYVDKHNWSRYPDMGYSFCNCHNIFFTKTDNLIEVDTNWNNYLDPMQRLSKLFDEASEPFTITMLDPYFINWNSPHEMFHWECRKIYILWDMDEFVKICKQVGFEVVSAIRDMDVNSATPQHFHITVRKP